MLPLQQPRAEPGARSGAPTLLPRSAYPEKIRAFRSETKPQAVFFVPGMADFSEARAALGCSCCDEHGPARRETMSSLLLRYAPHSLMQRLDAEEERGSR